MDILGFYMHKDDEDLIAQNVMVVIDEGHARLTCYSPTEQHSEMDWGYFNQCLPITKEQYLEASKLFYTPNDYLD